MSKNYWIIATIIQVITLIILWPLAVITAIIFFVIVPISQDIIKRGKEK